MRDTPKSSCIPSRTLSDANSNSFVESKLETKTVNYLFAVFSLNSNSKHIFNIYGKICSFLNIKSARDTPNKLHIYFIKQICFNKINRHNLDRAQICQMDLSSEIFFIKSLNKIDLIKTFLTLKRPNKDALSETKLTKLSSEASQPLREDANVSNKHGISTLKSCAVTPPPPSPKMRLRGKQTVSKTRMPLTLDRLKDVSTKPHTSFGGESFSSRGAISTVIPLQSSRSPREKHVFSKKPFMLKNSQGTALEPPALNSSKASAAASCSTSTLVHQNSANVGPVVPLNRVNKESLASSNKQVASELQYDVPSTHTAKCVSKETYQLMLKLQENTQNPSRVDTKNNQWQKMNKSEFEDFFLSENSSENDQCVDTTKNHKTIQAQPQDSVEKKDRKICPLFIRPKDNMKIRSSNEKAKKDKIIEDKKAIKKRRTLPQNRLMLLEPNEWGTCKDKTSNKHKDSDSGKIVISIENALGLGNSASSKDEGEQCPGTPKSDCNIYLDPRNLRHVLMEGWMRDLCTNLPDKDEMKKYKEMIETTKIALELCDQSPDFKFNEVHIYTDGSGNHYCKKAEKILKGTFATTVYLYNSETNARKFLGYMTAFVKTDPKSGYFLGATKDSSGAAELSAIVWAQLYILSNQYKEEFKNVQYRIISDSEWAINMSTRYDKYSSHPLLCQTAQAMQVIVEQAVNIEVSHIPGHMGDPYNELADYLCRAHQVALTPCTASDVAISAPLMCPISRYISQEEIHFLEHMYLMFVKGTPMECAYPPINWEKGCIEQPDQGFLPTMHLQDKEVAEVLDRKLRHSSRNNKRIKTNPVRTLLHNVKSLKSQIQRNTYEVQMVQAGIHIAGFQETQSRDNETKSSGHEASYITVSSKRESASEMGCELWISKKLPFGTINGEDAFINNSQVIALVQEPRLLVVRCISPVLNAILIVAHAPWNATEQHMENAAKREKWYSHFEEQLLKWHSTGLPVLVFADLNTKLNPGQAPYEQPISDDTKFNTWWQRINDKKWLHIPTIDKVCTRDPPPVTTYWESTRQGKVLTARDYYMHNFLVIASPKEFYNIPDAWRTDVKGRDHVPVVGEFLFYKRGYIFQKRRVIRYDRNAIKIPENIQKLEQALKAYDPIPFGLDPSSHSKIINQRILDTLCELFPKPIVVPKDPTMTAPTLRLIMQKHNLNRSRNLAGQYIDQVEKQGCIIYHPDYPEGVKTAREARESYDKQMKYLKNQAQKSLNNDRANALREQIIKTKDGMEQHDTRTAHAVVRTFKTFTLINKTSLRGKDGATADDNYEISKIFQNQFSELLEGKECTFHEVVAKIREETFSRKPIYNFPLRLLPTMIGTLRQYRVIKGDKAPGENTIVGEVYKHLYRLMAIMHMPLYFKSHLYRSPPVYYRGGLIGALLKRGASPYEPTGYRDVTLADVDGKTFGADLRTKAKPEMNKQALPGMYGSGLNGGSTDVAHLHLIAMLEYAKAEGKTAVSLFVDLSTAFASLCRRIVLQKIDWEDDQAFIELCVQEGIDRNIALDFLEYVDENPLCQDQTDQHIENMITQMHTHTWSSFEYIKGVIKTKKGVLAGTPLADLLFTFLMVRFLTCVEKDMREQGLIPNLPYEENNYFNYKKGEVDLKIPPISFMDDMAFILIAENNIIIEQITKTVQILYTQLSGTRLPDS